MWASGVYRLQLIAGTSDQFRTFMTITETLDEYLRFNSLRAPSARSYRAAVRHFLASHALNANDWPVRSIQPDHVALWRDELLHEKRLSPATFNNYRKHICVLLNFAVKRGYLECNPVLVVRPVTIGVRLPKRIELSTLDNALIQLRVEDSPDVKRPLKSLTPEWYYAAMLRVLFFTGMRRAQLVGLEWRDIDFERRAIVLRMEHNKARRDHVIPMFDQIVGDLLRLKKETLGVRYRIGEYDQVFDRCAHPEASRRWKRTRLSLSDVNNFFKSLSARIGVTISPHRLRHTAATEIASSVLDVRVIQELLGHSDPATSMIYIRASPSALADAWKARLARGGISGNVDKCAPVGETGNAHQRFIATP